MKIKTMFTVIYLLLFTVVLQSQSADFKVNAKGIQVYNFADKAGRNQVMFFSTAPLENMTGTASGIQGSVSFDPTNVSKTITGEIIVEIKSMMTGISRRDEHMQGENWLDAAKYPTISFKLKELQNVKTSDSNQIHATAVGDFTLHGITKRIEAPVTLVYMEESEKTKSRAPGDLLQLRTKFTIKLSDYGVGSMMKIIGSKVGENIDIEMNIVGSNAVK